MMDCDSQKNIMIDEWNNINWNNTETSFIHVKTCIENLGLDLAGQKTSIDQDPVNMRVNSLQANPLQCHYNM